MFQLKYLPKSVESYLQQFKGHFRCAQGRHFVIFCWLLVGLIVDQGKGKVKGLSAIVPEKIKYWAMMRMIRSGLWDGTMLVNDMARQTLLMLPPPIDGVLYLIGDSTLKGKRGKKHPLGFKTRINDYAKYTFGFEIVLLVANWGKYRVPVAIGVVSPKRKGHPNILFRNMLREFVPPSWAKKVIVLGDAGFAAKKTFRLIGRKKYDYVFAVSRTRKFENGKHLADLVRYLPKKFYHRMASYKPDGRRKDYWVYSQRESLKDLGDVTVVLSKRRRNDGPRKAKIIVTNLAGASVSEILTIYTRRWGVELTIKELKGALHLGQMQVTSDGGRVARSVALSVLAYLLLLHQYGQDKSLHKEFSIFKLKQKFTAEILQEQLLRSKQHWQRKLERFRLAA